MPEVKVNSPNFRALCRIKARRLQPPIRAKKRQPWIVAADRARHGLTATGGQVLSSGWPVGNLVLCFLLKSGGAANSNMGFKPPLDREEKKEG